MAGPITNGIALVRRTFPIIFVQISHQIFSQDRINKEKWCSAFQALQYAFSAMEAIKGLLTLPFKSNKMHYHC